MAYISSVKFLANFSSLPLLDEVGGYIFDIIGDQSVNISTDGSGYQMKSEQSIQTSPTSVAIVNTMTIGFSLIPVHIGMAKDSLGNITNLNMSLLSVKNSITDNDFVQVYEKTQLNGNNKLVVNMLVSNSVVYSVTTPEYTTGTNHIFCIAYNGVTQSIVIYIDGALCTLTSTGTAPTSLNVVNAIIRINKDTFNNTTSTMNSGVIDEIFILNSLIDATTVKKIINNTIEYTFDILNSSKSEISQIFLFDDPNAFRATSMYSDGSSILVTRSDGIVLEGSPKIWETRKKYNITVTDKIISI